MLFNLRSPCDGPAHPDCSQQLCRVLHRNQEEGEAGQEEGAEGRQAQGGGGGEDQVSGKEHEHQVMQLDRAWALVHLHRKVLKHFNVFGHASRCFF